MAPGFSREELPLIVIVGPTASGKTSLAVQLAEKFGGEIICADSRTIYRGMDIGTAKPSFQDRARVPHWGLDLVNPGERFTAVDFKQYADKKIEEIKTRGHIPFLVGGTGLYVDAVVFDFQFGSDASSEWREKLERMTLEELYDYCNENNLRLPENYKNKRYVIRAIERKSTSSKGRSSPTASTIIVGIATEKDTLLARITERTEQLLQNGVVDEATILGKKYGWEGEAMTGNIYRLAKSYIAGHLSLREFKEKNTTSDWRLAKRQLTWLKRNPHIQWFVLSDAREYLTGVLAKYR